MLKTKLLILTFVLGLAALAICADRPYYSYPTAKRLRDTGRILIYDNLSGSRNVTGSQIKSEALGGSGPLIKQAASTASTYERVLEIRDKTGKIVYYTTQNGTVVFGTPSALSVSSVYPVSGATVNGNDVLRSAGRPSVTFNKSSLVDITTAYIQGNSSAPVSDGMGGVKYAFNNFSGMPGITYTMKVVRDSIVQTDGETTSSCGTVMTDVSGVCQSTFTMQ